jgi:hypothetical protein
VRRRSGLPGAFRGAGRSLRKFNEDRRHVGDFAALLYSEANRYSIPMRTELAEAFPRSWQTVSSCSKFS